MVEVVQQVHEEIEKLPKYSNKKSDMEELISLIEELSTVRYCLYFKSS